MTRRGSRSTATHVQRVQTTVTTTANGTTTTTTFTDAAKERDFLLRRHQMLRRAAGYMLAKKYRTPWYAAPSVPHGESLFSKTMRSNAARVRRQMDARQPVAGGRPSASKPPSTHGAKTRGYTREELINFWKDLPPVAKRALLRIHRDVYITALDQYLVRQNLCCECHDNVFAEWEDLERQRAGSRSLQDVFSVFPPFLSDEDDDEDDEDDDEEEEEEEEEEEDDDDECQGDHCRHHHHEFEDDLLDGDDVLIEEEEEMVFKYELEGDEFRRASNEINATSNELLSDEYLAALEVGKRQEDEILRLIQKEERYIIIREDHSEFIMDLIRCGEQFSSYVAALRPTFEFTDDSHESSYDDDDEDAECPGANTSHLAQEYLLEVLAIKFREQLESAYQAALQHSLAVQAELLREEIAELQRDQKQQQQQPSTSSSKNKKKKERKKKKKKSVSNKCDNASQGTKSQPDSDNQKEPTPETSPSRKDVASSTRRSRSSSTPSSASKKPRSNQLDDIDGDGNETDKDRDNQDDDSEAELDLDDVDREVEEFRLLLEKINAQRPPPKSKPKLVLPPGAFSMMA